MQYLCILWSENGRRLLKLPLSHIVTPFLTLPGPVDTVE